MPHIHKIFKHSWSKIPTRLNFRPYRSRSGSSWRRLFSKNSKSEASTSQGFFENDTSECVTPRIETLQLTRASILSIERELPKFPPPAAGDVTGNLVSRPNFEEQHLPEKTEHMKGLTPSAESFTARDTERQTPLTVQSRQEYVHTPETPKEQDRTSLV